MTRKAPKRFLGPILAILRGLNVDRILVPFSVCFTYKLVTSFHVIMWYSEFIMLLSPRQRILALVLLLGSLLVRVQGCCVILAQSSRQIVGTLRLSWE
jgi:hypothetical protein